jgi:N-methylhydantoinase B
MNNTIRGGSDSVGRRFASYETVSGGAGALPYKNGANGVQVHMTNTANTPIEALESSYPLRIEAYELIEGSGGKGEFKGGMGVRRSIRVLNPDTTLSIQSERRKIAPRGLAGGGEGERGRNYIIREGERIILGSKVTTGLKGEDVVVIESPGGGGYGKE